MRRLLLLCAAAVLAAAGVAEARNIDLVTLPPRAKVQLTIYNSEDLTLVRETRSITFKKGVNRLQFSWANTLIDPTSVYLRPLAREADLEVLDTTFPGDRPQVLIWNVDSKVEAEVPVEVTYFTSGISWAADYVMVTDPAETQARVEGYVTVANNSGEDYEGAEVRLVVGVINLVEKIAQLAQGPGVMHDKDNLQRVLVESLDLAEKGEAYAGGVQGLGERIRKAPVIVKEGLSEYFIFTVEGTQTIPSGWSQRMVSFKAAQVPFEILYRYRPHQYGPQPVRFFLLANDAEHKMGESPLPDGIIRVFRENGKDGLNFFTAQAVKYIPIKEKIELNVGWDKQVVYERVVLDVSRQNFIFEGTEPAVVGWDETRKWQEEIRNYRAKPIKMEMRHVLAGDVDFRMEGPRNLYDYQTAEYVMEAASRKPLKWTTEGTFHLGKSQKQQRIQLIGN